MPSFKNLLRRVPWLYRINAWFKCWQVKSSYQATLNFYQTTVTPDISVPCWSKDSHHIEWIQKNRRPRVFFMGTDEQQDKGGFLQALERFAEVESFFREDGAWGQNDPAPYDERRKRNTQRLWMLVSELAAKGWIPDLLLTQTWGCLIDPLIFNQIREAYGTRVINIAMDDRHQYWGRKIKHLWDGTYPLIPYIDLTLTAAPEAVEWYRKEGGAAFFFPEASDSELFSPMPELPKCHDVCFVGSCYGIREKIVTALRENGIQVTTYGSGWGGGRIATEDVPRLFAQSKIVLGVSAIGHCPDFVGLKMRDFDAPMSGSCYLTQDNQDLYQLYHVGSEIVTYRSVKECVSQAQRLLANDEARERIARAGRVRAATDHTWNQRFTKFFASLRGE